MKKMDVENAPLSSLLHDKKVLEAIQDDVSEIEQRISTMAGFGSEEDIGETTGVEREVSRIHEILDRGESPNGYFGIEEAIILETGRPALLIQGGEWEEPRLRVVRDRLAPAAEYLKDVIPKVGRIELLNHPTMDYVGTGWMIDEDVMITNRHVANTFAYRTGSRIVMRTTPFGRPLEVQTDFNEEHESPNPPFEVVLVEVLFIEDQGSEHPDMALLRLEKVENLPTPIELSTLKLNRDDDIAVIGYPAKDAGRNDPFVMDRIFKDIYNVKRLSPGRISGIREDRFILTHDCTTLGGNSGSVILNLQDGKAAGLHFAGNYKTNNFAITSETIREKLADLGRRSMVSISVSIEEERTPSASELETRTGYDPDFLNASVPIPEPSGNLADELAPVNNRDDGLLHYTHFSIAMHKSRRLAMFTACNIDGGKLFSIRRGSDSWNLDPRMNVQFQVGNELYRHNPLDRGHLVRRLDPAWGNSREDAKQAVDDTFFYTNAHPQHAQLNQRSWLNLEEYILDNAANHDLRINVFTGPAFHPCDREYRDILIPQEYWKVVTLVNEFTGRLSATAYLLSQADLIEDLEFVFGEFQTFQVPIQTIENKTGLRFGNLIDYDPLGSIESIVPRTILGPSDLIL